MTFKFVISDPKTGKSYKKDFEKKKVGLIIGMKVGQEFDAGVLGLPGYKLQITGGSDISGFPIRHGVSGIGKKKVLMAERPGYKPKGKGVRKRKFVRGTGISEDLVQINTKVTKYGKESLDKLLGTKKEEAKPEETKEAPKAEEKPEAPKEEPKKEEPKKEEKPKEEVKPEKKVEEKSKENAAEEPKVEKK